MPEHAAVSTYEPRKETIGNLLSMTNPSIVVPDWQRNYSWDSEHIETFWNDMVAFQGRVGAATQTEYFLGSVVIVRTADGNLQLLDGQQRLATAAILVSAVRDSVAAYKPAASENIQSSYLVGHDYVANKVIHKLRLNTYDRDFFRQLTLSSRGADYVEPTPEIASHNLMLGARHYFEAKLGTIGDENSPKNQFDSRMALLNCLLNQMTVIAVYSTDEDSAADVFETLNDRGIGLSTPDLLRNLIMRRAAIGAQQAIIDLWRDVVSFDTDAKIRNYLRHFWVSREGDVKTQSLYREMKRVIVKKEIDSLDFSTQISNSAARYRLLLEGDTENAELNSILQDVAEFGASSRILYPVLLAIMETLPETEHAIAARLLLNVFVRHAIILQLENSRLENRIYRAARTLRTDPTLANFIAAISAETPSDEEVTNAFSRLSVAHNGTRRYLLKRIEISKRATEELEIANASKVHVEHVYPQSPTAANRWPHHGRFINRLGNLTLLSAKLNRTAQNGSFADKLPFYRTSDIQITQELSALADWSTQRVDERQEAMALLAPSLWPV